MRLSPGRYFSRRESNLRIVRRFFDQRIKKNERKKGKKKKLDRKGKEWKYQRDNFPNIFLIFDEKEDTHTEEKTNKRSCDKFINDFN